MVRLSLHEHWEAQVKLWFVLVGGGAKGRWQAGAFYTLAQAGWLEKAEGIVGTSVGGLNACMILAGLVQGKKADLLKDTWVSITQNSDIFSPSIPGSGWAALNPWTDIQLLGAARRFIFGPSFFDTSALQKKAAQVLGKITTEDVVKTTGKQLLVRAFNYEAGEVHTLTGRLQDMALCTSAIEGVFPSHLGYGDGGAADNAPLDVAVSFGATHVVVVYCGPQDKAWQPKSVWVDGSTPVPPGRTGLQNAEDVANKIVSMNEALVWQICQSRKGINFLHVFPGEDTGSALDFSTVELWDKGVGEGNQAILQAQVLPEWSEMGS